MNKKKIYKDETIIYLILKLSNNMNNFRLSSYIGEKEKAVITTFEIVTRDLGEVILANSLEYCASNIGISRYVLLINFSSSADSPFVSEIYSDKYNIKRIGVFFLSLYNSGVGLDIYKL